MAKRTDNATEIWPISAIRIKKGKTDVKRTLTTTELRKLIKITKRKNAKGTSN